MGPLLIEPADPQGAAALALLHEAALEARRLYPELIAADAPLPGNPPNPPRGVYLLAWRDGVPVGCGALRPLHGDVAELRRMFVTRAARGAGIARALLGRLEQQAARLGYATLRLETGMRQQPAIALYRACGYRHIAPFGEYAGDPTSVCFEKPVDPAAG